MCWWSDPKVLAFQSSCKTLKLLGFHRWWEKEVWPTSHEIQDSLLPQRATTLVSLSASGFSLNDTDSTLFSVLLQEDMLQSMGWQRLTRPRDQLNWTRRECGGESSCVFLSLHLLVYIRFFWSQMTFTLIISNFIIYSYLCIIFFSIFYVKGFVQTSTFLYSDSHFRENVNLISSTIHMFSEHVLSASVLNGKYICLSI